jgi:pimeloyl-ACP methyl ester carboxylesterase
MRTHSRSWHLYRTLLAPLLLAGATLIVLSGTTSASPSKLTWSRCDTSFRCAVLTVPANYASPAEGSLGISVVELPATGAAPIGDIVINPGGPGGSGIQFLTQSVSIFPASLRQNFNLVSFDPRGVGASDPVNCTDATGIRALLALNPAPTTKAEIATVVAGTKAFVAGCEAETPKNVLLNVSTLDTARDLDQLRIALGGAKLNYLGFSYGTYLGEQYMKLFPHNFRAMVLDGVVNPALTTTVSDQQQAVGFEVDLHDFYNWCPTNATCKKQLPQGAKTELTDLLHRFASGATESAALAPLYGGTVKVTYGILTTAVIASLYASSEWPGLAQAIHAAEHGNGEPLVAIAYNYAGLQQNGTYDNMLASNTATNCEDNAAPTSLATYQALARQMAKAAPDFGAGEAWGTIACTFWPEHIAPAPAPIRNLSAHTVLVIGSTQDPATPYAGSVAVTKQLGNARLLTREGSGHTGYEFSACIRTYADQYFTSLALPPSGTTCASNA